MDFLLFSVHGGKLWTLTEQYSEFAVFVGKVIC